MTENKKTHSLNILLLKTTILSYENALKDQGQVHCEEIDNLTCKGVFCYKQNPSKPPKWLGLFSSELQVEAHLFSSGAAAVFIVEANLRLFALCFGYGRYLLKDDCFEENFGLKVVLNSVNPEKIRSIDIQSLDAVPLMNRSQASVATEINDFGLDVEQDLIFAATGKSNNPSFGNQITGKDSFKLTIPASLSDFPLLLPQLLNAYSSSEYKKHFAWVDNLSEVRDKAIIAELDIALTEKIAANDLQRTWLTIPEVVEWSDIAGFRYQKVTGDIHQDIDWISYIAFLAEKAASTEQFKKHYVLAISESSGQQTHAWSVFKCIYCELQYAGGEYCLNNGKWYRINSDFLSELDNAIANIPSSTINLPAYQGNDEGAYNQSVYDADPVNYALMDKQLINHGGGNSKIEFCDLYMLDKKMIHVKRYGGSSVLSHLFAQGAVAARLFLSDPKFREKLNEKLPVSHRLSDTLSKPNVSEYELIYAIATNNVQNPALPLFSKVNLRNSYNQLQMYGLKASIKYIQVS